jgi:hypothetical protein
MQVSYNRLKNPSKNLWCNRQAKRDRHKLVNFVVPDKSEKFPGSQRNWDVEISTRKVKFGGLDLVLQERPLSSDSPIPMSQTSNKEKFRLLSEEVRNPSKNL